MNELKLPSIEEARKLAAKFKQRAVENPNEVARRKEWGDEIVRQVISGLDKFKKSGKFPETY